MDLISLIATLVVIGLALWAINTYIPMQAGIKNILNIVVVICVVVWLFDLFVGFGTFRIPVRAR